jgi:hypothetical protein
MSVLSFKVIDRKDRGLCNLTKFEDKLNTVTIEAFMITIVSESDSLRKKNFDVNRMRLTVGNAKGRALADKRMKLKDFFTKEEILSKEITLVFKDLGPQISWKLVFLIEYFGPILLTGLLMVFQNLIYGKTFEYGLSQKIGLAMCVGHYVKREFETLLVHRFSNDTMPFFNVFKNSAHYWILMGFCSNYFLLHPHYTSPRWITPQMHHILMVLFVIFEFFNLMCHITLRNLRAEGTSQRGIPQGWGFQLSSCANYFWESMAWLTFAVSTNTWGAYLFWIVSTAQMYMWAVKKH